MVAFCIRGAENNIWGRGVKKLTMYFPRSFADIFIFFLKMIYALFWRMVRELIVAIFFNFRRNCFYPPCSTHSNIMLRLKRKKGTVAGDVNITDKIYLTKKSQAIVLVSINPHQFLCRRGPHNLLKSNVVQRVVSI
jgi:hypothetical protein